jgi:AcrR family transcriptional regulator
VGRWEPDARGRLEQAALELYLERGYDQTTVAEIAARAGLTERTFFRHYADKREVLFRSSPLTDAITASIDGAPGDLTPLATVGHALEALADFFDDERRPHARDRQTVVDANPALQERELMKMAALATTITAALRRRGTPETTATLVAETGIALFKVTFERWLIGTEGFDAYVRDALTELRAAMHP